MTEAYCIRIAVVKVNQRVVVTVLSIDKD